MSARKSSFAVYWLCSASALGTQSSVPFINADDVHSQGHTGAGVTVAVIDAGIDFDHPGLAGSIAFGGASFEGGALQHDAGEDVYGYGHGTYMSLIVTDASGVAPASNILPVRVFGIDGADPDDVILGIQHVTQLRQMNPSIRVINLSLGSGSYSCPCDFDNPTNASYQSAISAALGAGIVAFAATGNEAQCGSIHRPACVSSAVKVAASYDGNYPTTDFGFCGDFLPPPYWVTCFSNIAESCDLLMAAPGYDITVGGFSDHGTSQATAHCSGVAALMFEKNGCGALDAVTARGTIFNTATGVKWAFPSCPLPPEPRHVNALAAVNAVSAAPCIPGDVNCDGLVNIDDVAHFVQALVDPTGYDSDHDGNPFPTCNRTAADVSANELVNGADIQLFVDALLSP